MSIEVGLYFIRNNGSRLDLDLAGGNLQQGAHIVGNAADSSNIIETYNQLWIIRLLEGESDTYTIMNLTSGLLMSLPAAANRTPIVVNRYTGTNEQWVIKHAAGSSQYRIQNVATQTFVDNYNGGTANGTEINGWTGSWSDNTNQHQLWNLVRVNVVQQ